MPKGNALGVGVAMATIVLAGGACRPSHAQESPPPGPPVVAHNVPQAAVPRAGRISLLGRTTAIAYQKEFRNEKLAAWRRRVPQVALIQVPSTMDGERQRALWYDSGS